MRRPRRAERGARGDRSGSSRRLVVAVLTLVALPGCGGGDGGARSAACQEVSGSKGEKPKIGVPDRDPPTEMQTDDLVVGDGAEAPRGATVSVHYVGVAWSTGEEFDTSWDRGQPISFGLDQVITGWQDGIPGMKAGGRRCLVIPPDLAYGASGAPPAIGPNETLIFVVDLLEVK